jgi:hypothetical protein
MFLDAQARGTCPVNHDAGAHTRFGVSMPAAAFSSCSMPPAQASLCVVGPTPASVP